MQSVDSCGDGRTTVGKARKEGAEWQLFLRRRTCVRACVDGKEEKRHVLSEAGGGKGDRWESGSVAHPSASDHYFRKK